jgi:hypothetical protein
MNYLIAFKFWIQLNKFYIRKYQYLFIGIYACFHFLLSPVPVLASVPDCNNIFPSGDSPSDWRQRFPFDLVYPVGSAYTNSNTCPKVNFWGKDREICSVGTVTKIVKNAVLFKVVINSLFTL